MADNEDSTLLTSDDFKITSEFTPQEYEQNWSDRLSDLDDKNDFAERNKVFNKFYKHIWNLLFGPDATPETRIQAVKFLELERPDAAFFNPFMYNDWIRNVKDEIIKCELFDLWINEFVPKQLGLIWAMDSDYFDDIDDPEPREFYKLNE